MGAVIVASFVVVWGHTWIVSVWRYVAAPSLEQTVQSLEKIVNHFKSLHCLRRMLNMSFKVSYWWNNLGNPPPKNF